MKKAKKKIPSVIALSLVVATLMVMTSGIASAAGVSVLTATPAGQSIHGKINMSEITGEIAEPPQLTSAASAVAKEKEWYEYIYYSPEPVGQYYLSENTRMSFYDPYDYEDALIMEVDDTITDWSSMNSLQVSYTTGNSLTDTKGESTDTTTSLQVAVGNDVSTSESEDSTVTTEVEGRVETYNHSKQEEYTDQHDYWGLNESAQTNMQGGITIAKVEISATVGAEQNWGWDRHGEVNTHQNGWTEDNTTTTATTTGGDTKVTSTIADRVTTATGSTVSSDISLSANNSTTITKTYDAAYFNASGSPLQWKIIQYTVKMPMKYQIEYLVDGEWIFGDYSYCLLNTIQGTCRAWLQNSVAYYEHWGDGSPVTWNEFWSQFFTEESLVQAYQNKLYPDN